ncbi:unnamed protein product [Rotaria sordida]|uniref:TRAF1-6 MATH domain-containing protein n=1 Tax=Rotaria sordida TaxID=392033 RepID=A0A815BF01_9BILA|nr:unnamed protein product [Rotaria sordida]
MPLLPIRFGSFPVDAQSERQTSIYSPRFYSSPTGYKMRTHLYLYGDGNARRTHISLFFVLMRVDFGDMPKTLSPYALSLNPRLPTDIQQIMIKQEVERKAQQQSQLRQQTSVT